MFISKNLVPYIIDVSIMDSGDVLSDHIPIRLSLDIDLTERHTVAKSLPSVVNWRNIDDTTRRNYERIMAEKETELKRRINVSFAERKAHFLLFFAPQDAYIKGNMPNV